MGLAALPIASSDAYGPAAAVLHCRLYFGDTGAGIAPSAYGETVTLTASPWAPVVGQRVTVRFSGTSGPKNGPIAIPARAMTLKVAVHLSGSTSGVVTVSTPYPTRAVAADKPMGAYVASGSFIAARTGPLTMAMGQMEMQDNFSGTHANTYCGAGPDADFRVAAPISTTIKQAVTARADTYSPVVKINKPKHATQAKSWKKVTGSAADVGTGVKAVYLKVKDGKVKKSLTVRPHANGTFTAKLGKLGKGRLTITYWAVDGAGNRSHTMKLTQRVH